MWKPTGTEMTNCRRCRKLFVRPPRDAPVTFRARHVCIACLREEADEIRDMQNAMRDVESISIEDLGEKTGLAPQTVKRHLRDNHFDLPAEGVLGRCTKCGQPAAATHRFCARCRFGILINVTRMKRSLQEQPETEKIYRPRILLQRDSAPSGILEKFQNRRGRMYSARAPAAGKGKYSGR
ncbi:hypothetical protein ACFL1X_11285 [Candidatus Hydrogenedentota bacterium]